jgi:hypothetical protein
MTSISTMRSLCWYIFGTRTLTTIIPKRLSANRRPGMPRTDLRLPPFNIATTARIVREAIEKFHCPSQNCAADLESSLRLLSHNQAPEFFLPTAAMSGSRRPSLGARVGFRHQIRSGGSRAHPRSFGARRTPRKGVINNVRTNTVFYSHDRILSRYHAERSPWWLHIHPEVLAAAVIEEGNEETIQTIPLGYVDPDVVSCQPAPPLSHHGVIGTVRPI